MKTCPFFKALNENFSSHLEIPKKHLEGKISKFINLIGPMSNKRKIRVRSGRNVFILERGWKEFCEENSLQKNDTLYFYFKEFATFNVAIFDEFAVKIREKRTNERINGENEERERVQTNNGFFCNINETEGPSRKIGKKNASDHAECSYKASKRGQVEEQTNATEKIIDVRINGENEEKERIEINSGPFCNTDETEGPSHKIGKKKASDAECSNKLSTRGRVEEQQTHAIETSDIGSFTGNSTQNKEPLFSKGGPSCKIGKKKSSETECSNKASKRGRVEEPTKNRSSNIGYSTGNASQNKETLSRKGQQILEESSQSEAEFRDSLNEIQKESPEIISISTDSSQSLKSKEPSVKKGKPIVEKSSESEIEIEFSDSLNEIHIQKEPPEINSLSSNYSDSRFESSLSRQPTVKTEVESSDDSDSESESSDDSDSEAESEFSDSDSEIGRKKAKKINPKSLRNLQPNSRKANNKKSEKTTKEDKKFKSRNPNFMKVMQLDNVYKKLYYLCIPTKFGMKHFPKKSIDVALRLDGNKRTWKVRCTCIVKTQNKTHIQWRFSGGWNKFCLQNKLKENDTCVFELTKRRKEKIELTVNVFRS